MRLTSQEIDAIRSCTLRAFGEDAVVRLFGSRPDDALRGGDIDLHIEREGGRPSAGLTAAFRAELAEQIGERAIDLVFHAPGDVLRPIDRTAYAGIRL